MWNRPKFTFSKILINQNVIIKLLDIDYKKYVQISYFSYLLASHIGLMNFVHSLFLPLRYSGNCSQSTPSSPPLSYYNNHFCKTKTTVYRWVVVGGYSSNPEVSRDAGRWRQCDVTAELLSVWRNGDSWTSLRDHEVDFDEPNRQLLPATHGKTSPAIARPSSRSSCRQRCR